ncbi:hypothetical protein JCM10213v2_007891 [Rhodosporidiobolus nylandii]
MDVLTLRFSQQKGNPGACGEVNSDDALICALYTPVYASGSHCGETIKLSRTDGKGGEVDVVVADECPTCEGDGYIDLSTGAYLKLGTKDEGVFPVSWYFA